MLRKTSIIFMSFIFIFMLAGSVWATGGKETSSGGAASAAAPAAGKYQEAPMLAEMVASGELPPVDQRLPKEPHVLTPVEEIGEYGGTLRTIALGPGPWNTMQIGGGASQGMFRLSPDGTEVLPNLAKGYDFSDDFKTFTVYLREGLRWSDGAPLTADDFIFMHEDMDANKDVKCWYSWGSWDLEKLDDYSVRYTNEEPDPSIEAKMGFCWSWSWFTFQPRHYLEKWHIKYNPDAAELAKEEGFENWYDAFRQHSWHAPQKDFDMPTANPWTIEEATTSYKSFVRNPYYGKVDSAGNQLPYIDKIYSVLVDSEVAQIKMISGEVDIAYGPTSLENYSLYKENEAQGNYRTLMIPSSSGNQVSLFLNLNEKDPEKRAIYQNVNFRRALSLAINRKEINESIFFGLGVPRQATALPTVSFYKKEWGDTYAEYDTDRAKQLLDEVGLTKMSADGFRLGPDGEELLLMIEYTTGAAGAMDSSLELVKDYWEKVGIKTFLKSEEKQLFRTRSNSTEYTVVARAIALSDEAMMYMEGGPGDFRVGSFAKGWGTWLGSQKQIDKGLKTLADFEGGVHPGEEPPEEFKELESWVDDLTKVQYGSSEFRSLATKIFDFHAQNLFIIGTVGVVPKAWIVNNDLRNVPGPGMDVSSQEPYDSTGVGDQFFFKTK